MDHARCGFVGHLRQVGTLHARLGVLERVEVAGRQRGDSLGAHHHSGLLDDVEHLRDAVVHLADEPADLAGYAVLAERQLAGRGGLQAHLVLDVGDEDAVALAGLAGLEVEVELRHEEQRETLGAGSGTLGAGQHQVQDVLAEVVGVTGGDEPLHAVDVPRAVGLLHGLGAACADVGAGIGLGEHHGGRPPALSGEDGPLLLLFGAQVKEDVGEASTHGIHVHRWVGAEDVLHQGPLHGAGHRHAAELFADADLVPATIGEGPYRLLKGGGQRHGMRVRIENRRVAVGLGERFRNGALSDPADLRKHLAGGVRVQVGE